MLRNSIYSTRTPKIRFARQLRKRHTSAERLLWKKLRAKRFHGYKFRRQVPIGPFIVDFLCAEKRLIIEVDGDSHFMPGAQERDARREAYLCSAGFRVYRCGNVQLFTEIDGVLAQVALLLEVHSD
jgi:very-short-patch-repair endonuclease